MTDGIFPGLPEGAEGTLPDPVVGEGIWPEKAGRCALVWRLLWADADAEDADKQPDVHPMDGATVRIRASRQIITYRGEHPTTFLLREIICRIEGDHMLSPDGKPWVILAPTDGGGISETGWTYTATVEQYNQVLHQVTFSAPADCTLDLTLVTDTEPSKGDGVAAATAAAASAATSASLVADAANGILEANQTAEEYTRQGLELQKQAKESIAQAGEQVAQAQAAANSASASSTASAASAASAQDSATKAENAATVSQQAATDSAAASQSSADAAAEAAASARTSTSEAAAAQAAADAAAGNIEKSTQLVQQSNQAATDSATSAATANDAAGKAKASADAAEKSASSSAESAQAAQTSSAASQAASEAAQQSAAASAASAASAATDLEVAKNLVANSPVEFKWETVEGAESPQVTGSWRRTGEADWKPIGTLNSGVDGVSVQAAEVTADGNLVLTMSRGDPITAGNVIGPQGVSVKTAEIDGQYHLILTLDDGTRLDAGASRGADGKPAPKLVSGSVDESTGILTLQLDDASSITVEGSLTGPVGPAPVMEAGEMTVTSDGSYGIEVPQTGEGKYAVNLRLPSPAGVSEALVQSMVDKKLADIEILALAGI